MFELTRQAVDAAVAEYDSLNRLPFLKLYGFPKDDAVFLRHPSTGHVYDARAIAGAALHDQGDLAPSRPSAAATAEALSGLGFEVIDVSVGWVFEPGDQIRRVDLHRLYGGSRQNGIAPSTISENVLIFSEASSGEQHGYVDVWDSEGTFHYTGEGQTGDQSLRSGNKAIAEHHDTEKALRVFDGAGGDVTYLGEFQVDPTQPHYPTTAPSTDNGPDRQVIVFRLQPTEPGTIKPAAAVTIEAVTGGVEAVPVEANTTSGFDVAGTQGHTATRREQDLVLA